MPILHCSGWEMKSGVEMGLCTINLPQLAFSAEQRK